VVLSAFGDAESPPSADALEDVLGDATPWWTALISDVRQVAGELVERWVFGGPTFGWSLRLVRGDRVLVYLTPQAGRVLVGVALGEKAIATAVSAGAVSDRTMAIIASAPRYAEGRGVRFPVASPADLEVAHELARIKLSR
jgi:Protein of unknown function (DUF3788)